MLATQRSVLRALCPFAGFVVLFAAWSPRGEAASSSGRPNSELQSEEPNADELLTAVYDEFGTKDRKYESLRKKLAGAIGKELQAQGLEDHPFRVWVHELADQVQAAAQGRRAAPEVQALLEAYPWGSQLQLPLGLELGSDRPVPRNQQGFVYLENPPRPLPGYPELEVNYYLYGLDEVFGWQGSVQAKRDKVRYIERESKDSASIAEQLPAWEELRVCLAGTLPEVPLFAIPQFKRLVHTRLKERRGEPTRMDRMLALLDSKWDGYAFEGVVSRDPVYFVAPVHEFYVNPLGFAFSFPASSAMAQAGDLPFMAIQTYMQYSEVLRGEPVTSTDLIGHTSEGVAAVRDFDAEMAYLTRYKTLLDLLARSILSPESALPAYLKPYAFPAGQGPDERKADATFQVGRSYALLLWAAVGEDPVALADWLHDEILSKPENAYPGKVSLPVAFTVRARSLESRLLNQVVKRAAADPGSAYARKYAPFVDPESKEGAPNLTALIHSYAAFHAEIGDVIRKTAIQTVSREL